MLRVKQPPPQTLKLTEGESLTLKTSWFEVANKFLLNITETTMLKHQRGRGSERDNKLHF